MRTGTVYLIHFEKHFKHAKHYIGFTSVNVEERFKRHKNGSGSSLLKAVSKEKINFIIARTWPGKPFSFEKDLKHQKNSKRFCPICNPEKYLNYF
jgi:predicted GIY-YIG superfamily endonuclease